jgi:hypothetical protein
VVKSFRAVYKDIGWLLLLLCVGHNAVRKKRWKLVTRKRKFEFEVGSTN